MVESSLLASSQSAGGITKLSERESLDSLRSEIALAGVAAQQPTPDPGVWRPVSYVGLQKPNPANATYVDIWKDAIEANNRHYRDHGDLRFAEGNAPAVEARFVIWSQTKSVVLSILNTAASCTQKEIRRPSRAIIKLCPMRIAIYEGMGVRTMDGGKACFLELTHNTFNVQRHPTSATPHRAFRAAAINRWREAAIAVEDIERAASPRP